MFGAGPNRDGATTASSVVERLAELFLHLRADAHGAQVVYGGNLECGAEAGGLFGVGELIDLFAGHHGLEDGSAFGGDDGAGERAVREVGKLGFDELDTHLAQDVERGVEGGAGAFIGPVGEVDRGVTDAQVFPFAMVFGSVIKALAG